MMIEQVIRYIHDILNITVSTQKWEQCTALPYFLQDNYAYYLARIHGLEMLLMVETGSEENSPAALRKHINQVRDRWHGDVVYVREQVSSFERKRLIGAGIPFIVPGNQLYLPMLALDLREYYRRPRRKKIQLFSPATQVLALYWVYSSRGSVREVKKTLTEMAEILGYSKMTMSRAYKEIDTALAEADTAGKYESAQNYDLSGHEFWQLLQPYWRSPIKRRCYLLTAKPAHGLTIRAGLTALASYSILAEPRPDVYAMGLDDWKMLQQKEHAVFLDRPDPEAVEVEIWIYQPNLLTPYGRAGTVDPLSLYLSLREDSDERVEMALKQLLGGIQW